MIRLISRRWWFGILGLAWLASTGVGQAWEHPHVNTEFKFRFEVTVGPEQVRPTAPWYTYFPADPRLMPAPSLTPYPSWPRQFPPLGPPADKLKAAQNAPRDSNNPPSGPMLTQYRTIPYAYGSSIQPVSYVPAQAPSYWYQGR
jgi:hypothetical protein